MKFQSLFSGKSNKNIVILSPAEFAHSMVNVYSGLNPASIMHKSIADRYRPVSYPDGPISARYRVCRMLTWKIDTYGFQRSALSICRGVGGGGGVAVSFKD